ncbi:MAG: heme NO-binding domain-containing protein [Bacteroidia bacterium]|nr:heme NO-binding domain-containing protein [Bacteroidia bacterium]
MYGIVNKAIQDLITENFGEEKWEAVKERSDIDIDYFLSNEPYDDAVTYKLAIAASEELGITVGEVLIVFGEYWILNTGKQKYSALMESGGDNLKDFLINLPNFHNRVMFIYPNLTPPEFRVSNVEEKSIYVHYHSKREGLQDFVKGLLQGLGKFFGVPVTIDLIQHRGDGFSHEIFKVNW